MIKDPYTLLQTAKLESLNSGGEDWGLIMDNYYNGLETQAYLIIIICGMFAIIATVII